MSSVTNRAAAIHSAAIFAATIRLFQGAFLDENLVMAGANSWAAYGQPPVSGAREDKEIYRAKTVVRNDRWRPFLQRGVTRCGDHCSQIV